MQVKGGEHLQKPHPIPLRNCQACQLFGQGQVLLTVLTKVQGELVNAIDLEAVALALGPALGNGLGISLGLGVLDG